MYSHKKIITILLSLVLVVACSNNEPNFQGYVEGEYIYLASPFSGNLTELYVQRGQVVTTDQQLFVLDQEPQVSDLSQTEHELQRNVALLTDLQKGRRDTEIQAIEAQIKQTEAELDFAKERLKRMRDLFESGAGDEDSFDEAISNHRRTQQRLLQYQANLADAKLAAREDQIVAQEASVQTSQAAREQAAWALKQKTVFAPTSASVFDTYYKPGEFVTAGQPVLSLLAPENVNIIFFLPEPMLSQVSIGQTIELTCNGCPETYKAEIYYISPDVEYTPPVIYSRDDNYKLVYRIKALPAQPEAFNPGQPVRITLISQPDDHATS